MTRSVPDWLAAHAQSQPDREAVRDATTSWSFAQLDELSGALAAALVAEGVAPASRIATLQGDDARAVSLIHAVRRLGAVLVPLSRRLEAPELGYQLAVAGVDLLVHDAARTDLALAAVEVAASAPGPAPGAVRVAVATMAWLQEAASQAEPPVPGAPVDLGAAATIMFTSGTTARPKAAVLSHGNHVASAGAWARLLQPGPDDRWLACLPLFHVAGLAMVMRASLWGVGLEVHGRFELPAVQAALASGASHLSLVAALLERLIEDLADRPAPPALRAILLGGGPLLPALLERSEAAGLPVITTYGMTETASGLAAGGPMVLPHADPGALRPLSDAEMRVLPGSGEIHVRGPMVFDGYLDPESHDSSDPGGWFATGDIGTRDPAGYVHVSERRDDLFISGGENISPAEVEAVITAHPAVSEAIVVGRPDARWGEVPIAVIVVAPGAMLSDATLATFCRERLARFKVPVAFHRRTALPRNAAGKLLRRDLRTSLLEVSD